MPRRRDHEEEEQRIRGGKIEQEALMRRRRVLRPGGAVDSDEEEEEEVGEDGIHLFYFNKGFIKSKGKRNPPLKFQPILVCQVCSHFLFSVAYGSFEPEYENFINDAGAEIPEDGGRMCCPPLLPREDYEEDVEDLRTRIQERYKRSSHKEYDEETTDVVEQQALLPSVKDPRLWKVECLIRSAVALDHLKSNIYIEADKEAHVKDVCTRLHSYVQLLLFQLCFNSTNLFYVYQACRGIRNIFPAEVRVVPIKEMTDVLSVERKMVDLAAGSWVRMKIGKYKGYLAKVVNVDSVRQRFRVKLIAMIDLQAIANKMIHIHVDRRRDPSTREYFYLIDNMWLKDGSHFKVVSIKSVRTQNVLPTIDEIVKFRKPRDDTDGDMAGLSTLLANRKKGSFMEGDAVVVVQGDLKNLRGWVEKVEEENVHITTKMEGLLETLAFNEKDIFKYFKCGDHVKVVSGSQDGAAGMVVEVEGHIPSIFSDTAKEHVVEISLFVAHCFSCLLTR
ncbi:Transcription elongation factor Spt5 [Cinnamomum micranthum f. kanehirae]|uniref:Transcription elongation factor Spt5 n=1 Tax=Cinnamomum micranthum f. kanehirae TaxID=337451 RepID=A0A443N0M2_9MAGN|nr:Transcription elongation factor Spt5 [Cinnamomum micranthum f. kanehirae]